MPEPTLRNSAVNERLIHIRELWSQLAQTRDPKERDRLEHRIRDEAEAYKQDTGCAFDS